MKYNGRIIILLAALILVAGCTPKGIISKNKMSKIYYDMYLMDQYTQATPEYKRIADTCALYKFILADYGCTADEFRASIDYYLQRSKDMKDILGSAEEMLKAREASILKEIDRNARKSAERAGRQEKHDADTLDAAGIPSGRDE